MHAPAQPPLGFGIFGLGMVADFHAQAIAHVTGGRLVAVASRQAEKARAFAARHGAAVAGATIEELVARRDVDVVCITTPASAHLAPALAAIRAGKHLVVEKPLEITVERTDEMLRAAEAAGVKIAAIFQGRFGDGARTVKAALDAGRFGRIVLATADVKWHRTAQYYSGTRGTWSVDGGGACMAQAIHSIDLLQWYAGMPEEVFCRTARRVHAGIEAEDTAVAALTFASGALGTITATTAAWPGWRRRIELCGENGSAALEDDHVSRWDFRDARPEDEAVRAAKDTAALGTGASAPNAISFVGHQRQIQDLVDAVREGRAPACDGHEGRKAVALVRALYESAETGKAVRL
ncbi:MAG TPA: Gfo/Idh/MocA family oxidoreductase [Opitutus sp.]|nr:Gfo/Idh/MocA family oxidoreductase [Opitutus sp.]